MHAVILNSCLRYMLNQQKLRTFYTLEIYPLYKLSENQKIVDIGFNEI